MKCIILRFIIRILIRYSNIWVPDSAFLWNRFGFSIPSTQVVNLSLNNPNPAFVRGIEIDWQTNFWYLPKPFNALVLDVNYTKSGSNTDYTIIYQVVTNKTVFVNGHQVTISETASQDTSISGKLVQQANDVVNADIGIDYKGFSGRLAFSMTGNLMSSVGGRPEEMQYTGNIYRWDFSLKQELPINGLSIALNGMNIFHNGISFYRDFAVAPGAPVTKNLMGVLYSPTTFELNLRYSI